MKLINRLKLAFKIVFSNKPVHHSEIHKIVFAIKALNQAEELSTVSTVIDNIRNARNICWQVGEDLGVDISKQLSETEQMG